MKAPHWLESKWLLSKFGINRRKAIKGYRNFAEEADIKSVANDHEHLVGGFILGNAGFVNWVKETFLAVRREEKEVPQLMHLKPKVSIEKVLLAVCEEFGVSEDHVLGKGKKANKARDLANYLARDLRAHSKITSHFRIPSSGHLCPILNRKVLEIVPLLLWLCISDRTNLT